MGDPAVGRAAESRRLRRAGTSAISYPSAAVAIHAGTPATELPCIVLSQPHGARYPGICQPPAAVA
jgi:hypothetical protein